MALRTVHWAGHELITLATKSEPTSLCAWPSPAPLSDTLSLELAAEDSGGEIEVLLEKLEADTDPVDALTLEDVSRMLALTPI